MGNIVRNPKQSRSIETKKRIVEAGYALFAEKGYFNTNTAEIAKKASVSTGIVYGYFRDKRDILLDVLDIYITEVFAPVFDILNSLKTPDLGDLIDKLLDYAIDTHSKNAAIHEALHSLVSTDLAVKEKFAELERLMTENTVKTLRECGMEMEGLTERVHLTIVNIQAYAHEAIFDDHSYIDYPLMRTLVKKTLVDLFH